MKKFITGALLLLIGISGFSFNFMNFLNFAAGLVPVLMVIGGALAVYLGIEELKQSDNSGNQAKAEPPQTQQEELNKETTGKSENQTKPVPDTQSTDPAPETPIKTEEKSADKQQDAQPEEKASPPPISSSQVTETPAPEEVLAAGARVQFKGNIETLVFHSVACNFASGKNCSMEFTTKEEADAQGYKPCKICMSDA
ncbi:hypothetical protein [Desulfobacter sp.]|uniref:hypothetical protein n=1 Tax=Desulfobacter sp. TaxID=2294 RepID=UPI003D0E8119